MKIKSYVSFGSALLLSLSSLLIILTPSAHAATMTWDGEGADDNFSTAANWAGDIAPANGDSIVFPVDVMFSGCTANVALNNDLDPNTVTLAGITLSGTMPTNCSFNTFAINGSDISISGNISGLSEVSLFIPHITVTAPITVTGVKGTSINIGSNDVILSNSSFSDSVSGTGKITLKDNGGGKGGGCGPDQSNVFAGDGSGFTGAIDVVSAYGLLRVTSSATDFARNASQISVSGDGSIGFVTPFQTDMTFDRPLNLSNNVSASQSSYNGSTCETVTANTTLVISSDVTFTGDTTFYLYHTDVEFTGNVTGQENVSVADGVSGSVTFPDGSTVGSKTIEVSVDDVVNCYEAYNTANANNKVMVNVDCSSSIGTDPDSPLTVSGILAGKGKVGHVQIASGGVIAPGQSPGCLSTGNLTMVSGSAYDFEVGGATECSEYDQLKVVGAVDLGGGTLNTISYNSFAPINGQSYKIIDNDGSDAVTGTFASLPEGATFTLGGAVLKISYVGGDGNDVVLSVSSSPATPDTGFKLLMNNPLLTLVGTTAAAGGITLVARKQRKALKN